MTDDQAAVIDFLSRGESYGLSGVSPERIDTHASVVFLLGDRVYKLKRAVRYSYLDYSTLAARERCCRSEFDLNRRTAPELYLGVRAVTHRAGGFELGGQGAVVDWVVEMRRFDDNSLFDKLAMAGRLTPALLRPLADVIAAFHVAAEKTPGFGGFRELAEVIADNHRSLSRGCPPLDQSRVAALSLASNAALQETRALLDARRDQGKVRRCHGDLHLRNICLFHDKPTLFDCIEFSDPIACIDVLYDFAFLLMDMEHRRLRPLANIVSNRYLDRTGDDPGLPALPLFLSVRAAVRAKVALATLSVESQHEDKIEEARAYLDLAEAMLRPSRPRLIAIGGLSGTGKSTVAAALAPDFAPAPGARIIRSDVLRKAMMGVAPETRLPPTAYDRETTAKVYHALSERAAATLAGGYTAIVDAAFLATREREAIAAVAHRLHLPFEGLWLDASDEIRATRVAQRHGDASDADLDVLRQQRTIDAGRIDWHRIDADGDSTECAAAARRALDLRV